MLEPEFHTPPQGEYWPHTWVVAGDMVISLTREGAIPDALWERFVADARRDTTKRMLGLGFGAIRVNARQRRGLVVAMHDNERRAGVLGSSVARGIATALSWMGTEIRAFSWSDVPAALEYLKSPEIDIEQGVKLVEELLRRSNAPTIRELAAR